MRVLKGLLIANVIAVLAVVVSCGENHPYLPGPRTESRSLPPVPSSPTLSLEKVWDGKDVSQYVLLKDRLMTRLSDWREAFVMAEETLASEVMVTPSGTFFKHQTDVAVSSPKNRYQLVIREGTIEGQKTLLLFLKTSDEDPARKFAFKYDIDLYGAHLFSKEEMPLFESVDENPRQLIKLGLKQGSGDLVIFRYILREEPLLVSNEDDLTLGGKPLPEEGRAGYRRVDLSLLQQTLVIPISGNGAPETTDAGNPTTLPGSLPQRTPRPRRQPLRPQGPTLGTGAQTPNTPDVDDETEQSGDENAN